MVRLSSSGGEKEASAWNEKPGQGGQPQEEKSQEEEEKALIRVNAVLLSFLQQLHTLVEVPLSG